MNFKNKNVSVPELAMIAGTRLALGIGIGLLISDYFTIDQRRGAGWALVIIGVLITVPLIIEVFRNDR